MRVGDVVFEDLEFEIVVVLKCPFLAFQPIDKAVLALTSIEPLKTCVLACAEKR